jgi:TRAP-type transport system small permease protein
VDLDRGAVDLPMPFIFCAWPVAGATWLLFLVESSINNLRTLMDAPRR